MARDDQRAAGTGGGDAPQAPWRLLHYPDEAAFTRIVEDYPELAYNAEANVFVDYLALAPWLRLGWPSPELWTRCRSIRFQGKALTARRFAEVQALYPDRPGVAPEDQDLHRLLAFWPSAVGQPFVEYTVKLMGDVITLNDLHYSRGRHRLPRSVASTLARIESKAIHERIKAVTGKDHGDKILGSLMPTGDFAAGVVS